MHIQIKRKKSGAPAFAGGVAHDEIDRLALKNGAILRARKNGDAPATVEIRALGWQILDAESAADLALAHGIKARNFIQKHAPQLLEKK